MRQDGVNWHGIHEKLVPICGIRLTLGDTSFFVAKRNPFDDDDSYKFALRISDELEQDIRNNVPGAFKRLKKMFDKKRDKAVVNEDGDEPVDYDAMFARKYLKFESLQRAMQEDFDNSLHNVTAEQRDSVLQSFEHSLNASFKAYRKDRIRKKMKMPLENIKTLRQDEKRAIREGRYAEPDIEGYEKDMQEGIDNIQKINERFRGTTQTKMMQRALSMANALRSFTA
eukprot:1475846-Prymnesium_polylepis.1